MVYQFASCSLLLLKYKFKQKSREIERGDSEKDYLEDLETLKVRGFPPKEHRSMFESSESMDVI